MWKYIKMVKERNLSHYFIDLNFEDLSEDIKEDVINLTGKTEKVLLEEARGEFHFRIPKERRKNG